MVKAFFAVHAVFHLLVDHGLRARDGIGDGGDARLEVNHRHDRADQGGEQANQSCAALPKLKLPSRARAFWTTA